MLRNGFAAVALAFLCATALAQSTRVKVFVRFEDASTSAPLATPVTANMLEVEEDGKAVKSVDELRSASDLPVRYIAMFDCSGSGNNSSNSHTVRKPLAQFLARIVRPGEDTVALVNFSDEFYLDSKFTSDMQAFAKKLKTTEQYRGGTALFDAVRATSNFAGKQAISNQERRIILLFSDGEDNASRSTLAEALWAALQNKVSIFALNLGRPGTRGAKTLAELADVTGGRMFERVEASQSSDFFDILQQTLQSEYLLTFTPAEMPLRPRKLAIAITQKKVTVVAPRYVAAP